MIWNGSFGWYKQVDKTAPNFALSVWKNKQKKQTKNPPKQTTTYKDILFWFAFCCSDQLKMKILYKRYPWQHAHSIISKTQFEDRYNSDKWIYTETVYHGHYSLRLVIGKNIERHTAYTIVSWPNPKQWIIVHTSDLMMITRQSVYSLYHHKGNG